MRRYLLRRVVYALLTFLGITAATFALVHSVPGDPIDFYAGRAGGRTIPPEVLENIRREHHLDQPLAMQYGWWVRSAATLDFGESLVHRRDVSGLIAEKLPNTFLLNLIAFLLAAGIGVPVGLWAASRRTTGAARLAVLGFDLLYSLPAFWVALLLLYWLSVQWDLLPLFGMTSDRYDSLSLAEKLGDRLRHLALPVLTLAYGQFAIFARFSRAAVSDVIRQDFIIAARARGASPGAVLWRHTMRNALMPLISLLGLTVPLLISGSVIVERIFQWDGIGMLYFDAILARDYPVVMAMTVVTALVTLAASVTADVLYAAADPRVRLEEERHEA